MPSMQRLGHMEVLDLSDGGASIFCCGSFRLSFCRLLAVEFQFAIYPVQDF